jgi:predicted PhzF superfamily epimerase YddE/YHI9
MVEFFQVNAFTTKLFEGNPAGVSILSEWLPDSTMQQIAAESHLATSAFLVNEQSHYRIRWFTPACEIFLCGHATLAAGWILANVLQEKAPFHLLTQQNTALTIDILPTGEIQLDFPPAPVVPVEPNEFVKKYFKKSEIEGCYFSGGDQADYFVSLTNPRLIEEFQPDFFEISQLPSRGLLLSAPEDESGYQFRTRFFVPKIGIPEDIATGSAHCLLAAYWNAKIQSNSNLPNNQWFESHQGSTRRGTVRVKLLHHRVLLASFARLYMRSKLFL